MLIKTKKREDLSMQGWVWEKNLPPTLMISPVDISFKGCGHAKASRQLPVHSALSAHTGSGPGHQMLSDAQMMDTGK